MSAGGKLQLLYTSSRQFLCVQSIFNLTLFDQSALISLHACTHTHTPTHVHVCKHTHLYLLRGVNLFTLRLLLIATNDDALLVLMCVIESVESCCHGNNITTDKASCYPASCILLLLQCVSALLSCTTRLYCVACCVTVSQRLLGLTNQVYVHIRSNSFEFY